MYSHIIRTDSDTNMDSPDWVASAYRDGVPMGGDLNSAPADAAPVFLIAAVKEAHDAKIGYGTAG